MKIAIQLTSLVRAAETPRGGLQLQEAVLKRDARFGREQRKATSIRI